MTHQQASSSSSRHRRCSPSATYPGSYNLLSPSGNEPTAPLDSHSHVTSSAQMASSLIAPQTLNSGSGHEQINVETDLGDNGLMGGYPYPYQADSQSYMMSINAAAAYHHSAGVSDGYNYPMISYPDGITYAAIPPQQAYQTSNDNVFRTQMLAAQAALSNNNDAERVLYESEYGEHGIVSCRISTARSTSTEQQSSTQPHLEEESVPPPVPLAVPPPVPLAVPPPVPLAVPLAVPPATADTHSAGTSIMQQNSSSDMQPELSAHCDRGDDTTQAAANTTAAEGDYVTPDDRDVINGDHDTYPPIAVTAAAPPAQASSPAPDANTQGEVQPPLSDKPGHTSATAAAASDDSVAWRETDANQAAT